MSKKFTKKNHSTQWIRLDELTVIWPQAQRRLDHKKSLKIAAELDPDAFGILTVTLRDPKSGGKRHIVDGQNRWNALFNVLGWDGDQCVLCEIIQTTSPKEAARSWLIRNGGRRNPQALDRFKVAVTGEFPDETAVNGILTKMGYHVAADTRDGAFYAVEAALSIYRRHGETILVNSLLTIQEVWGRAPSAVTAVIVQGVTLVLIEHGDKIDRKRLVKRIGQDHTPTNIIGRAKGMRELRRGTMALNVARVLIATYNLGLRHEKRLIEKTA